MQVTHGEAMPAFTSSTSSYDGIGLRNKGVVSIQTVAEAETCTQRTCAVSADGNEGPPSSRQRHGRNGCYWQGGDWVSRAGIHGNAASVRHPDRDETVEMRGNKQNVAVNITGYLAQLPGKTRSRLEATDEKRRKVDEC